MYQKKRFYAAAIFLCLCALLFSRSKKDEFYLKNVPSEYIGTYIPVQYDNILKKTRSHYAALFSNDGDYHDVLYVQKHICYSDLRFHDGYAITAEEFGTYSFITKKSETYIINANGNSYKKIGDNHNFTDVRRYVLRFIFEDALQLKNVELTEQARIIINGVEFEPVLDPAFFETDGVALWLRSEHRCGYVRLSDILPERCRVLVYICMELTKEGSSVYAESYFCKTRLYFQIRRLKSRV